MYMNAFVYYTNIPNLDCNNIDMLNCKVHGRIQQNAVKYILHGDQIVDKNQGARVSIQFYFI